MHTSVLFLVWLSIRDGWVCDNKIEKKEEEEEEDEELFLLVDDENALRHSVYERDHRR